MDTKEILNHLRTQKGLSQDELAEKVFVTRQAVSRWENGDVRADGGEVAVALVGEHHVFRMQAADCMVKCRNV